MFTSLGDRNQSLESKWGAVMPTVPHREVSLAYDRLRAAQKCFEFLELPQYLPSNNSWLVSDLTEKHIKMLCSDNWKTIIRIWEIKGML